MGAGQACVTKQDTIKRLRLRNKGEYKRCIDCGRVGLQAYMVLGEIMYGHPNDRISKGRIRKIIGIRFCRYCQVEFKEEE